MHFLDIRWDLGDIRPNIIIYSVSILNYLVYNTSMVSPTRWIDGAKLRDLVGEDAFL